MLLSVFVQLNISDEDSDSAECIQRHRKTAFILPSFGIVLCAFLANKQSKKPFNSFALLSAYFFHPQSYIEKNRTALQPCFTMVQSGFHQCLSCYKSLLFYKLTIQVPWQCDCSISVQEDNRSSSWLADSIPSEGLQNLKSQSERYSIGMKEGNLSLSLLANLRSEGL